MGLLHLTVNETHAILRGLDGLGELNAHLFKKRIISYSSLSFRLSRILPAIPGISIT